LISVEDFPNHAKLRCFFGKFQFNTKLKIDENLASLLGYYTSEGHLHTNETTKQISFRNSNKIIQDKIFNSTEKCFGIKPIFEENNTKITICYDLIYYLFKYCFKTGSNAYTKRVPQFLFNSPDEIVGSYISAYIDGDGTVTTEKKVISFSSVNISLLDELAFLLTRFNLIGRYFINKPRLPGKTVLENYKRLGKEPKLSILNNLSYKGKDAQILASLLNLNHPMKKEKAKEILSFNKMESRKMSYNHKQIPLFSFGDTFIDYIKSVEIINDKSHSYCLEVEWKEKEERNIIWGQQIINTRCDGDEACIMMLMDVLLNFSKKYLPAHKGATQDEPLLLSSKLLPTEVDDMVFDMDIAFNYPLEFYEAAMQYKNPSEIKISKVKDFLDTEKQYEGFGFTHNTDDFNKGVVCSAYKFIPSMEEKVKGQLDLAKKIRAVIESDVARLVIEKHFIRDIKGNLRKFSTQQFRCVDCNAKFRRTPLRGVCLECGGKILFTVSEGFVLKYLNISLDMAEKYDLPVYLKQNLYLTKKRIEALFGKEKDKQKALIGWFK
jgi:DNA polymerase II large subunit